MEEIPIALFVAQHRHPPGQCPASPGSGPLLLSRVSAATAARYGVTIEAEALIDGEHLRCWWCERQPGGGGALPGVLARQGCLRGPDTVNPSLAAQEAPGKR